MSLLTSTDLPNTSFCALRLAARGVFFCARPNVPRGTMRVRWVVFIGAVASEMGVLENVLRGTVCVEWVAWANVLRGTITRGGNLDWEVNKLLFNMICVFGLVFHVEH